MAWLYKRHEMKESQVLPTWKYWLYVCRWSSKDQVRWQEQKDFVGYDQKSKWYKLYIPNEGNIVINRIVEFN
jgi:hypothetical protein